MAESQTETRSWKLLNPGWKSVSFVPEWSLERFSQGEGDDQMDIRGKLSSTSMKIEILNCFSLSSWSGDYKLLPSSQEQQHAMWSLQSLFTIGYSVSSQ